MNKVLLKYCFTIVAILCMYSCSHYKDIPYFQNAASVASMVLTTESLVADIPEENPAPAMPAGGMGGMY